MNNPACDEPLAVFIQKVGHDNIARPRPVTDVPGAKQGTSSKIHGGNDDDINVLIPLLILQEDFCQLERCINEDCCKVSLGRSFSKKSFMLHVFIDLQQLQLRFFI